MYCIAFCYVKDESIFIYENFFFSIFNGSIFFGGGGGGGTPRLIFTKSEEYVSGFYHCKTLHHSAVVLLILWV